MCTLASVCVIMMLNYYRHRPWSRVNRIRIMRSIVKILASGLIPLLLLLLLPFSVGAVGLGIAPTDLAITSAVRGAEYERMVWVYNPGEDEINVTLGTEGEAADWVSFYHTSDPSTSINGMSIPGEDNVAILVKFNIPADAANGSYSATIYAETVPVEGGDIEGTATAKLRMPADVAITVTGTQILTGVVSSVTTRDTEVGYPLRIEVHFRNTGNVMATPQIDVEITKDDATVDSLTFAEAEVKPGQSDTISAGWNTTGRELGDYAAHVAISLGEEVLTTEELNFAILPVGTLTRAGALTELSLQGEPKLGTLTKVQATFLNTGQIDTKAKFIGELYCDNELIDTLESEEILVPVGQSDILASYVTPEKLGDYDIKGYVNYEGKKTEVKEISFSIGGAGGGHSFNWFILAVTVTAILAGVLAYMAIKRKRGKPA